MRWILIKFSSELNLRWNLRALLIVEKQVQLSRRYNKLQEISNQELGKPSGMIGELYGIVLASLIVGENTASSYTMMKIPSWDNYDMVPAIEVTGEEEPPIMIDKVREVIKAMKEWKASGSISIEKEMW